MNETRPVPDALLERYLLGELPADQMETLRRRAECEAELQNRLAALRASDEALLKAYSAPGMVEAISARHRLRARARAGKHGVLAGKPSSAGTVSPAPSRPFFRQPRFAVPAGLAHACGLLLTIRPDRDDRREYGQGISDVTETAQAYEIRLKGSEAGLAIFRKTRAGSELLPPQSLARPGDTLQVFYHSKGAAYGVVFSVDGAGNLTLHLPEADGPAVALQAGDMLPLPHAFRLDKAPRLERFFLITSAQPFSSENIMGRARAIFTGGRSVPDSLQGLEAGFRQYPYTLRKPVPAARREAAP